MKQKPREFYYKSEYGRITVTEVDRLYGVSLVYPSGLKPQYLLVPSNMLLPKGV